MEKSKQDKLIITIGSAILAILAIIAIIATIVAIVNTEKPLTAEQLAKKKRKLEAAATVPFGQYSFKRAIYNPNVDDLAILLAPMSKSTFEIKEDLFAIYDEEQKTKIEIKSPKYKKRIMKDESMTKTDGLRIYYEGGSIMPSESTFIGIEYTVYDLNGIANFRIYTFDDVVWISQYQMIGDKEHLDYVYELKKNKKEKKIKDKDYLQPIEFSETPEEPTFEDLGEVTTEAKTKKKKK